METFLTVILIIFVGFWLLGLIGKWLLRYWITKKQREFQQQFGSDSTTGSNTGGAFGGRGFRGFYTFGGTSEQETRQKKRPEGEVTVTQQEIRTEYQVDKSVGEYVEFEEVEQTETTRS